MSNLRNSGNSCYDCAKLARTKSILRFPDFKKVVFIKWFVKKSKAQNGLNLMFRLRTHMRPDSNPEIKKPFNESRVEFFFLQRFSRNLSFEEFTHTFFSQGNSIKGTFG